MNKIIIAGLGLMSLTGCVTSGEITKKATPAPIIDSRKTEQSIVNGQPYVIADSQVWDVPDASSGRNYQIYVKLPSNYNSNPDKIYPVLYVTDADYSFPVINRLGWRAGGIEDYILVGLSYAKGENGGLSRRRDYTPTTTGAPDAPVGAVYGGAKHYLEYIKTQVIPFVESKFRADKTRRIYAGHSYGGLFGAQILLNDPTLFSGYILGSPSLWYDSRYTFKTEAEYAATHTDLPADVFMFIGEYETPGLGPAKDPNRYDMVTDTQDFAKVLQSHNYPSLKVKYEVLNDEDHGTIAPRGYTHALQHFLRSK